MLETIEKAGGRMVSVTDGVDTDDPTARLMLAIRAEMARDEMTKLSTRVTRGKDEQRRRGEYLGGSIQYGLLRDRDAEYGVSIDHEAAEVLRRAVDMLIAGLARRREVMVEDARAEVAAARPRAPSSPTTTPWGWTSSCASLPSST